MSAPVLAFSNRAPHTLRLSPTVEAAAVKLETLLALDAKRGEVALLSINVMLRGARAEQRLKARRARNIGKPVITIDRDDREGA